jgi:hypothetical protein
MGQLTIVAAPSPRTEYIDTQIAARLLGMSDRWVLTQCELGLFKTAHQPSQRPGGRWKIARSEVLARQAQCLA